MNKAENLENIAKEIRKLTVEEIACLGVGHIGGSLSIIEILTVLYFETMNINPEEPQKEHRDRFVLSKGHAGPALYATLAHRGYFDKELLKTLNKPGTCLPSHCDMRKTKGIDMTTGSLGQGFSVSVGMALAEKMKKSSNRVFTIIGDGESQEGQIWESAMFAANKRLDNLIAFTDFNGLQVDGKVNSIISLNPLDQKWIAFGWNVICINGHSIEQILEALDLIKEVKDKPHMIIAKTVKAKGIESLEGSETCHNVALPPEKWQNILQNMEC